MTKFWEQQNNMCAKSIILTSKVYEYAKRWFKNILILSEIFQIQ